MLNAEMARERIRDRVREADGDRAARQTRPGKRSVARARTRRIGSGALAALIWPFHH